MLKQCSECGRPISHGGPPCQTLFDALIARDFSDYRFGRFHRLAVDCFCLQHPERYCASAKSLMAHLGGLCITFDLQSSAEAFQALRASLDGNPAMVKPALPTFRGSVTIAHVQDCDSPEVYAGSLSQWAESIWKSYVGLHDLAREWLRRAREASSGLMHLDR